LIVRSLFEWRSVFGGAFVRFTETDAWYHLRLVDTLLHHFPYSLTYDPYLKYPGGQDVNVAPGFDFVIASVSLALGRGAPSTGLVERVAAVVPPVFGAVAVVPIYALARMIFTPRAALLAAGLTVVMPGPFLVRTTLGFADHHAAEILFSTIALMLVVWAVDRSPGSRPWRSVLAAIGLTAYLASWSGGAMFVLALTAGVCAHLWLGHRRGDAPWSVAAAFMSTIAPAIVLVAVLLGRFGFVRYHLVALGGALAATGVFAAISHVMQRRGMNRLWYPFACGAVIVAIAAACRVAAPTLASAVASQIDRVIGGTRMAVTEATPLLASANGWPTVLFASFGMALPLAAVALVPMWRLASTSGRSGPILVLAWFVVAFAAMFAQVRFAYYAAVPIALLGGLAADRILARWPRRQDIAFLFIVAAVFVPNAQLVRAQAAFTSGPSNDWFDALTWLRNHSPDPFGDPAEYFQAYDGFSEQRSFPYPASAYGVLSWWDPGYWIIRIARRMPNANPTQANIAAAAAFFLATDESTARRQLDDLGTRYVIASSEMPAWMEPSNGTRAGYLYAMTPAADRDNVQYIDVMYQRRADGSEAPRMVYYPDYYRTMLARLYAFGGHGVEPRGGAYVAIYSEESARFGGRRKVLRSLTPAMSYEDALHMAAGVTSGIARVVGIDPFRTCVPVDALTSLSLVHESPTTDPRTASAADDQTGASPHLVRIFEYTPRRGR
jgi:dolichyl-diphosphooligosaccharide--protein glycosyltransferase